MNKIDTNKWQDFDIIDIFEVKNTHCVLSSQIEPNSGTIAYATASALNNGISTYIHFDKNMIDEGNSIFIGGKTLAISYQEGDYVSNDSHNLSLIIKNPKGRDKYCQLFMVAALYHNLKDTYKWSDSISKTSIKDNKIKLPIKKINEIDFEYMKSYMKKVENKVKLKIQNIQSINKKAKNINITKWKYFHLYDIFEIDSGTKLDKIKMNFDNPEVNFIGRSNTNQGITAKISKIKDLEPYKAGYLTLALGGAYLGSCFIQQEPFYTSQNVNVLIPKYEISDYTKQFICTVIFVESQLHYKAFIDELNRHVKTDFTIKLPVDTNNQPDWEYMGNYIKEISQKKRQSIELIRNVFISI